ncbi:MAG: SDR family oxidoreductase [Calditrichaeota bacterium]|nr:MAG: SDR family oxidoreductase [Calditrichota bacterium]
MCQEEGRLSMKRVFITGASGFLGSYLLELAPAGVEIMAQYHTVEPHRTAPTIHPVQIDFQNPDFSPVADFSPEVIVHTAAMSRVDACEQQRELAYQINVAATRQLADLAGKCGARMLFTSSDQIYNGERGNYTEADPPDPPAYYGHTKVEAERYILEHLNNAVSIRVALIYGRAIQGTSTFTEAIVNNLREGNPVRVFVDEYRSPILVNALAEAMWELAEHTYTGRLNLGGAQRLSRLEMGQIICELLHLDESLLRHTRVADLALPARRPRDCSFDISLARQVLRTPLPDF